MSSKDKPAASVSMDSRFPASEAWQLFGIMSEFVAGAEQLETIRPAISIFGSARTELKHPYYSLAEEIAKQLSDAGFAVMSGGGPGIMEAVNKGAFAGKSPSIGLNIQLPHEQSPNQYQDISYTFNHFFARKYMFVRFATAYVVMPGGFGTLDELMEALTLVQTGKTGKIPIILVCSAFWGGLIDWFKQTLVTEGCISADDINLIQLIDAPHEVVNAIFRHYEARGFEPTIAERTLQRSL